MFVGFNSIKLNDNSQNTILQNFIYIMLKSPILTHEIKALKMIHTSTYDIKEKCFTKDAIFIIAKRLYKEFTSQSNSDSCTIEFNIELTNSTSILKNDLSIFANDNLFDTKEISKFVFIFDNNEDINKKHIKFELTNKNHYISDLIVEGEKDWNIKLFDEIKTIID